MMAYLVTKIVTILWMALEGGTHLPQGKNKESSHQ